MASSINNNNNNNHLTISINLFLLLVIIIIFFFFFSTTITCASSSSSNIHKNQIQRGFTVTPHSSSLHFQPILTDPTSTFSLGFLRINSTLLDLAIIHLQSSFPLWRAIPNRPASWSSSTCLSFNGTLLLSHSETEHLSWTTNKNTVGDALVLLNSSNLQIVKDGQALWQSFHFPSDTILENQNFTSKAALFSANQRFSMSLGPTYLALYMEHLSAPPPMYWKRTALQAKAEILLGGGPIYARLDPTGFLGLYQNETALVDVLSFDTFNSGIKKSLRRLTLESDGNLKAYYWSGSDWVSDFVAITDTCDLPTYCGAYGMCNMEGQQCVGCVDNSSTDGSCFPSDSGDLCGSDINKFQVVRRRGVDLMNKELLGFQKVGSLQECEGLCENNCSCWGAVYNNVSGYCYRMEYPIQTLLAVGDERKLGYFKVRNIEEEKGGERRKTAGLVLIIVGALVLAGGIVFAGYRVWNARRWSSSSSEDEMGMPYKDLNSSSFRSIQMSNSFRK